VPIPKLLLSLLIPGLINAELKILPSDRTLRICAGVRFVSCAEATAPKQKKSNVMNVRIVIPLCVLIVGRSRERVFLSAFCFVALYLVAG
jgi:hypothetical protein